MTYITILGDAILDCSLPSNFGSGENLSGIQRGCWEEVGEECFQR